MVGQLGFPILPRFDQTRIRRPARRLAEAGLSRPDARSPGHRPGDAHRRRSRAWQDDLALHLPRQGLVDRSGRERAHSRSPRLLLRRDFVARFDRVLRAAREHLGVAERTRLSLRYVNELRHRDGETLAGWSRLLRPELLGFAATDLLGGTVEHMIQEVRVQRDDGILAIRHGLLTGSVLDQPHRKRHGSGPLLPDRHGLLRRDRERVGRGASLAQIRGFDNVMYRFFRWTLGDALFEYLEPASGY